MVRSYLVLPSHSSLNSVSASAISRFWFNLRVAAAVGTSPNKSKTMLTKTYSPARWWIKDADQAVICQLCPRQCKIPLNRYGFCGVRKNLGGELLSLAYGYPVSIAIDPIEKKPLRKFLPGSKTFSFGTYGCNLNCCFCQNNTLSRGCYRLPAMPVWNTPATMVDLARENGCSSLSYTYNEPTVFAEYASDIASLAHASGLKNVLVSNGYISTAAAADFYPLIDAANIDMKGFSEEFYQQQCAASLAPVLASIEKLYHLGKHLEITTLVIPGRNDSLAMFSQWLDWVEQHLDKDLPLHFSAYHPAHRCSAPPTPVKTLLNIRDLAWNRGFTAIYLGNI